MSDISKKYLLGLFQTPRKNMERMAEVVPNSNDQAFQHFLSQLPWDEDNLIVQVANDANRLIGGHKDFGYDFYRVLQRSHNRIPRWFFIFVLILVQNSGSKNQVYYILDRL